MALGMAATLRNARLDAITTAVGNAGKLQIYDGTRPATGGSATTKLAEFTLGTPFAAAASAGAISPSLPSDVSAVASGTASWFRVTTSGGTFVFDGSAGTGGTDLVLNSAAISSGANVSITGFTVTEGNS